VQNAHSKSVADQLVEWIAQRLEQDTAAIDTTRPLTSLGLDSLKAVELSALVAERFGLELQVEELFEGLSIADVAELAVTRTAAPPPSPEHIATTTTATATTTGAVPVGRSAVGSMEFSLFFFSSDAERAADTGYRLVLDSARFADQHGFAAVWTPERHFHTFGGLFPNPSVLGAALATTTSNLRIRAGSVVLPLHDPVRVAEEWAVVDNLSGGRVDIAFATGWNADDFVFAPDDYERREEVLLRGVETVRTLWRGGSVELRNGRGQPVTVRVFPRPVQPELPSWVTCSGGVERFRQAGALGANVITALLFQDVDELGTKIEAYRKARADNGHDPQSGRVTLMLHTFLGDDGAVVRQTVRGPFLRYLEDSVDLWRRGSSALDTLTEGEREKVLAYAFERYYRTAALFGTPESTVDVVERLARLGVDEIACLVDFGVPDADVLRGLRSLDELRNRVRERSEETDETEETEQPAGEPAVDLDTAVSNRHAHARRNTGGVLHKAKEFDLSQRLRDVELLPFYTELSRNEGATCVYDGRTLIMLGSNNYLGLTADPRVRRAVADAALTDGSSLTGSRLLNGSTQSHVELERRLADFLGREDALLFATGYQANIGLLSALMGPDTVLVTDDECHASVYDGAAVGGCDVAQFRHNDVEDLDRQLAAAGERPAMVSVDGVYSMSGDLAPLREIHAVCDRYGVPLAVDDAHGLGMVGATGRGVEEALDATGCAEVLMGTFSKSLASVGGWLAGDRYLMEWVRYHGRSMLFSAAIPPPALAAASAALTVLAEEPWRIQRIQENADYWRTGLTELGYRVGRSKNAIVPVHVGEELACLRFAKGLLDAGVYANCVIAPAVAANKALIRTSVMATHERQHLDAALDIFATVGRACGLIP
jgi:8-amino-7-oxononanoate synthase